MIVTTDNMDAPEVRQIADSVRTARLAHWCDQCLHTIQPGQRYRRAFLLVDGEPTVMMSHLGTCG